MELDRVELPAGDDRHAVTIGLVGCFGVRTEIFGWQALGRSLAKVATPREHILPQFFGGMRPRKLAGHPDDGDGSPANSLWTQLCLHFR
jgi:hypothetical protein